MRRILLSALLASMPALPAGAQLLHIEGVLLEPRHPTTSDRVRMTVAGIAGCPSTSPQEPVHDTATGSVLLHLSIAEDCVATPIPVPFRHTFETGPLPAGKHFAEVRVEDNPGLTWRELFEVRPDTGPLDLGEDGRFQVRVHWFNPRDGSSGTGHPRRLARDSGAFWFFSQDNLEVTVKILDGRAVNGRWWVFIASMTDLQLEVEISRAGGPPRTYVQNAGANRNFIDVNASFVEGTQPVPNPTAPAIVIDPERPTSAHPVRLEAAVLDDTLPDFSFTGEQNRRFVFDHETHPARFPLSPATAVATTGPLAPGVYAVDVRMNGHHDFGRTFEVSAPHGQLSLHDTEDTYFNVYVNLDSPHRGVGHGVTLTRESGYFWFFDPDNVELTVKILDGRAVNGNYWVFIASMTDVAYTVEVERCVSRFDPFGCGSLFYRSVQGVNQNFIDVDYVGNLR